ncbi:MAG: energy transducer TonB [Planctomycetota bacterium]
MRQHPGSGHDLSLAFLGALAVHSILGYTSLLWSDVLYGVKPGPTSLQMELVANTREADVVAEAVDDGALLSEPEPITETLPDPEAVELPGPPLDEPDPVMTDDALASHAVPLQRVPGPRETQQEVATSPAPSAQTVEGNSDIDQAATDQGAESAPDYLLNPDPRYPEAARRRGTEGVVLLEVLVLANGTAGAVRIARTSGSVLLDDAALEGVRPWRFKPAMHAGVPVDSTLTVSVRFRLQDR